MGRVAEKVFGCNPLRRFCGRSGHPRTSRAMARPQDGDQLPLNAFCLCQVRKTSDRSATSTNRQPWQAVSPIGLGPMAPCRAIDRAATCGLEPAREAKSRARKDLTAIIRCHLTGGSMLNKRFADEANSRYVCPYGQFSGKNSYSAVTRCPVKASLTHFGSGNFHLTIDCILITNWQVTNAWGLRSRSIQRRQYRTCDPGIIRWSQTSPQIVQLVSRDFLQLRRSSAFSRLIL